MEYIAMGIKCSLKSDIPHPIILPREFFVNGPGAPVKLLLDFIENGSLTGSLSKPPTGDPSNLPRVFYGNGSLAGAPVKIPRERKYTKNLFSYLSSNFLQL
ncbi:hypothetical protein DPMN_012836 [Dreissena polymorpha]|uniref:Uncharacterized protein n=1 Tax=Dreissena polymorpha TaxID=45954 RepID=A0A9D4S1T2_DREPO|nr:hypothetical protein DPMN_012836 [Dreissena polymorpha]